MIDESNVCEAESAAPSSTDVAASQIDSCAESSEPKQAQLASHWRPMLILLFAALLILFSSKAKADEPAAIAVYESQAASSSEVAHAPPQLTPAPQVAHASMTIQLNGVTHVITPSKRTQPSSVVLAGATVSSDRRDWKAFADARPAYIQLTADMANFDADSDPDGWRAELVVRDRQDRLVAVRGRAEFELTPRVPTADFHNYVDASVQPMKWAHDVAFNEEGVAHFKLPLHQPLRPVFGWASSIYPDSGLRSPIFGSHGRSHRGGVHRRYSGANRLTTAVTGDSRNSLGRADFGELTVKLSVPSEGVFRAVTVTPLRPSVLVDTHWPYR